MKKSELRQLIREEIRKSISKKEPINELNIGQRFSGFLGKVIRGIKNINPSAQGAEIKDAFKRLGLSKSLSGETIYSVGDYNLPENSKYKLSAATNKDMKVRISDFQIKEAKRLGAKFSTPISDLAFTVTQEQYDLTSENPKTIEKTYFLNFETGKYDLQPDRSFSTEMDVDAARSEYPSIKGLEEYKEVVNSPVNNITIEFLYQFLNLSLEYEKKFGPR